MNWVVRIVNMSDFISDWLLVVSTAELGAGAVGDTLDLKAHHDADEVIWALAASLLPTRGNQTQVTAGQVMGGAGVFTLVDQKKDILVNSRPWSIDTIRIKATAFQMYVLRGCL